MIGARHMGGSITSNGGDSSPFGSVIVGRRPFEAACSGAGILPDNCGFHEGSLSGVTTNLPSKKSFDRTGTPLGIMKMRRLIDSTAVPAQNWRRFRSDLHPKFTTHRAKWVD
jgi:hypothetical protein